MLLGKTRDCNCLGDTVLPCRGMLLCATADTHHLHCHSALLGPGLFMGISLWAKKHRLYEILVIFQQAPVRPRQKQVVGIDSLQKLQ